MGVSMQSRKPSTLPMIYTATTDAPHSARPSIFLRNQDPQDDVNEDARKCHRKDRHQHVHDPGEAGIEAEVIGQAADHAGDHAVMAGTSKRWMGTHVVLLCDDTLAHHFVRFANHSWMAGGTSRCARPDT